MKTAKHKKAEKQRYEAKISIRKAERKKHAKQIKTKQIMKVVNKSRGT